MKHSRTAGAVLATSAVMLISACGSAAVVSPSPSPGGAGTPGGPNGGRRGAAGELAQINGDTLILNSQAGDVTVRTSSATKVQKTSTATVADIVPGTCILATGQKDASGAITAQVVRLSAKQNGSCAVGRNGGRAPGGQSPNATPGAGRSPGAPSNGALVVGEVTGVAGTAVTVQPATGAAQTLTVPTTVRVARSSPAALSDLAVGQCVQAGGMRDGSGAVTANNLSIVPPGPSGCFTGTGFGGRRGGAGAGAGGNRGD